MWSAGQGHETNDFVGHKVKGQGHIGQKLDSETWQRHQSRPLQSSKFSSLTKRRIL